MWHDTCGFGFNPGYPPRYYGGSIQTIDNSISTDVSIPGLPGFRITPTHSTASPAGRPVRLSQTAVPRHRRCTLLRSSKTILTSADSHRSHQSGVIARLVG